MKVSIQTNGVSLMLAALVLIFAATALAQGPSERPGQGRGRGFGGEGSGPEHRLEMLTEKLELTEDQQVSIGAIMEAGREKGVVIHKEMMRLHNELEGEMLKDEPSEKAALDLVKKIGNLRTETQTHRMQSRLEIREQLSPGQRDKMLMMKGRSGSGRGRGGRGAGPRFGNDCDRECDGGSHRRGAQGK